MNPRFALLVLPVLLLAACKQKPDDDDRTASGKVLEGTISDGMLPLDEVTSQPPLLAPEAASKPGADASDAVEGEEADDAASVDAAQPEVESAVE